MNEPYIFDLKYGICPPIPGDASIMYEVQGAYRKQLDGIILEMIRTNSPFVMFEWNGILSKVRNPLHELAELKAGKSREAELRRNIRDIAKERDKLKMRLNELEMEKRA